MKKFSFLLPLAGLLAYLSLSSNSSGIVNQSTAGCGGGNCHGGSASSATTVTLTSNVPTGGWVSGTTYTMTATVSNATLARAGFNVQASAGTLTAGTGTTLQSTTNQVTHSTPKAFVSGTTSWTFSWTAPATGTSVTFTMAGNAVNFNGGTTGDVWNTLGNNPLVINKAASAPAAPTVQVQGSTTVCPGGTYPTLTASSTGATSYAWSNGTTTVATTASFTPIAAGTYTATATNAAGTSSASTPTTITAGTTPSAVFTAGLASGSTYNFTYPTAGLTYLWTFGEGSASSTAQNPSYTYATSGAKTVKLRVINGAGCRDSTTQQLVVAATGIGSIAGVAGFSYGPNPTTGSLTLRTGALKADVRVRNLAGKTVAVLRTRDEAITEKTVSIAGLAAGLYFLEVETADAHGVDKLIIR